MRRPPVIDAIRYRPLMTPDDAGYGSWAVSEPPDTAGTAPFFAQLIAQSSCRGDGGPRAGCAAAAYEAADAVSGLAITPPLPSARLCV